MQPPLVVEHRPDSQVRDTVLAMLRALPAAAFLPDVQQDQGPDLVEVRVRAAAAAATSLLVLAGLGVLPTIASAALHNASTIGILAYAAMKQGEQDASQH